jgi:membrane fusion protein (multidrug efflux system)
MSGGGGFLARVRARPALPAAIAVAVALAAAGGAELYRLRGRVSTDDAFVEGSMTYLAAQVPGRVIEVRVQEHERVSAGQVLVRLDPADLRVRVERARADVAAARNQLEAAEASAASAEAEKKAAEVERWRAERELDRLRSLVAGGAASQQELDAAQAERDAAGARVTALELRARAERAVLGNQAPLEQARASLAAAELDLSHAEIQAPFDGVVGRKNVEPGAIVSPGQPLLAITADTPAWVMANFKETQLAELRPGAPAEVRIDAFPDAVWRGHVASFSPATGAKYALIPPEPAAGNFTKVVQRVPVKIVLDAVEGETDPPDSLPIGLSVQVSVLVR